MQKDVYLRRLFQLDDLSAKILDPDSNSRRREVPTTEKEPRPSRQPQL